MFRDYDVSADSVTLSTGVKEIVTPVKRKVNEVVTPTVDFPLTPPATVKSETISIEMTSEVNEHFVRRSKRRRITTTTDDPFEDV